MSHLREAGEGRASFVIWLAILIFVGLAAKEFVPARIDVAELEDYLVQSAARAHEASAKQIKANILHKAQELDLPVTKENLKVTSQGGKIRMRADYTIPIEMPFYTYDWNVSHDVERSIFLW